MPDSKPTAADLLDLQGEHERWAFRFDYDLDFGEAHGRVKIDINVINLEVAPIAMIELGSGDRARMKCDYDAPDQWNLDPRFIDELEDICRAVARDANPPRFPSGDCAGR